MDKIGLHHSIIQMQSCNPACKITMKCLVYMATYEDDLVLL